MGVVIIGLYEAGRKGEETVSLGWQGEQLWDWGSMYRAGHIKGAHNNACTHARKRADSSINDLKFSEFECEYS